MALQVDSPGQLQEFLSILGKRKWQILLPIAYCLSIGLALAVILPRKYRCTTQVELKELYIEGVQKTGKDSSISTIEAQNAPHQLKSLQRIREVVQKLGWTDYLALPPEDQNEYLEDIRDDLSVTLPRKLGDRGSTFVTIEYLDVNPQRAYELLLELRRAWISQVVERDRDRINFEYKNLLARQSDEQKAWQRLQRELSELKAHHDLSPTQSSPGSNQTRGEDPLYERLAEREEALQAAELELAQDDEMVAKLGETLDEMQPQIPRTERVEGQDFSSQITQLRVRRAQLERQRDQQGYRPAHSKWREIQREIEEIDESIADFETLVTEDQEGVEWVPNKQYTERETQLQTAEVKAAGSRQKRDTLKTFVERDRELVRERQEVYGQWSQLSHRIDESEIKLNDIAAKLNEKKIQMDFINGSSGNPFAITQEPVPPRSPSEPNPALILAFALVLGVILGLGSAVVIEFSKSSFRGPADIGRVMMVPVLGVVGEIMTEPETRRRRLRRTAVGVVSGLFVVTVGFVTYAWAFQRDLLTPGLRQGIEGFRELFM